MISKLILFHSNKFLIIILFFYYSNIQRHRFRIFFRINTNWCYFTWYFRLEAIFESINSILRILRLVPSSSHVLSVEITKHWIFGQYYLIRSIRIRRETSQWKLDSFETRLKKRVKPSHYCACAIEINYPTKEIIRRWFWLVGLSFCQRINNRFFVSAWMWKCKK